MLGEILKQVIKPREYVDNIFSVDLVSLKNNGIKGLLIDVDNTVLPNFEDYPSINTIHWFHQVKSQGFKTILISNTADNKRLKKIADVLNVDAYYFVLKPFTSVIKTIIEKQLKLKPHQAAIIGDQWLCDVLAGNWLDAYTILTKYCDNHEERAVGFLQKTKSKILEKVINN